MVRGAVELVEELRRDAEAMLGKIPMMARAMYPEYIAAANSHFEKIKNLESAIKREAVSDGK